MRGLSLLNVLPVVAAYGAAAAMAVSFTRYDGGVAFLWVATAVLIAALMRTSSRRWPMLLALCGGASVLNTGLLGLGWVAALPFALINLSEALVAVMLLRRWQQPGEPLNSLGWFVRYVVAVGVAAPLLASLLAGVVLAAMGRPSADSMLHYFFGHALGNLTFTPLALLLTGRHARRETVRMLAKRKGDAAGVLILVLATVVAVFAQSHLPLLFLPVMAIILATFRLGRVGAAIAVAILALAGGAFTSLGYGPIQLMGPGDLGSRMQFFQFYLAATVLTVLPVSADLNHRKHLLTRVRTSEERFRMMAEHSSDLLMHIAPDGTFLYVSPSMRQIGGHDPEALIGTASALLIAPEHLDHVRREHWSALNEPGRTCRFEYQGIMADGSRRWFETHSRALIDDEGEFDGVLSMARDITGVKEREERLAAAAFSDSLTGLPNRRAFVAKVAERERRRTEDAGADSLAIIDIDHFKSINDMYGHHIGDVVLKSFAQLMQSALRTGDLAARLGGEEFVILFPDTSRDQAMAICERLRRLCATTLIDTELGSVRITVSGGVAAIAADGLGEALKVADAALYMAKERGRDQLALAA